MRTNQEHRELYGEPDIVNMIKAARIYWLGFLLRMQDTRVPKAIMGCQWWKKQGKTENQVAG